MLLQRHRAINNFSYIFLFISFVLVIIIPFVVAYPMIIAGLLGIFIITFVAIFLFKRPSWALLGFVLLLPIHSLIMTVLIAQVGLPFGLVRIIAAWKESLLLFTVLIVLLRVIIRQRLVVLTWVDGIASLWLIQIFLYFLLGSLTPEWQPSLAARLYGARDWLLYLLPYFIGRLIFVSDRNLQRILKMILWVGIFTSLYGVFEYFFLPIEFHVQLGVPRYFGEFLGLSYPDYLLGLPPNYWAEVAGQSVRRSVSTYLNGQGFAVSFLLIIPLSLSYYFYRPTLKNLLTFIICALALLLTITRMTILVSFIQSLLILLLLRRYKLLARILLSGLVLFIIVLAINSIFRTFVFDTIFLRDTSSSARPAQWMRGLQTILDKPFGSGLGYAGQVGARFGGSGEGQEAGYFKLTGDLGVPGLLFFLIWFWGLLLFSLNMYRISVGAWKTMALSIFVTATGFLLNNFTAPPDQSLFVIYVFPFLAGITIRRYVSQRITRIQRSLEAARIDFNLEHIDDANIVPLDQS